MHRIIPPRVLVAMLLIALTLPIAVIVAGGLGLLMESLGDAWGAAASQRFSLILGGFWIVDLIALLLALATNAIAQNCCEEEEFESEESAEE